MNGREIKPTFSLKQFLVLWAVLLVVMLFTALLRSISDSPFFAIIFLLVASGILTILLYFFRSISVFLFLLWLFKGRWKFPIRLSRLQNELAVTDKGVEFCDKLTGELASLFELDHVFCLVLTGHEDRYLIQSSRCTTSVCFTRQYLPFSEEIVALLNEKPFHLRGEKSFYHLESHPSFSQLQPLGISGIFPIEGVNPQFPYPIAIVVLTSSRRFEDFNRKIAGALALFFSGIQRGMSSSRRIISALRDHMEKEILLDAGRRISASLDLEEVLSQIVDSLRLLIPYDAAGIFIIDRTSGKFELKTLRGYDRTMFEKVTLKASDGVSGWVCRNKKGDIVPDVHRDSRYVEARPSTRSEIAVPLIVEEEVIGVINLESDLESCYREKDLELLGIFANHASIAIQNAHLHHEALVKQKMEEDLDLARNIQKALLPRKLPDIPEYSFVAENLPSQRVSGDLYDVIQFENGCIGVAIGDIIGKGTPGAILMSSLYSIFKSQIQLNMPIPQILSRTNDLLCEASDPDKFATFIYGVLDPRRSAFDYSNAGHFPPLHISGKGGISELDVGGLVLGVKKHEAYEQKSVYLEKGDTLFFYTDGVTEAMGKAKEEFGLDRLKAFLNLHRNKPPDALLSLLIATVEEFMEGKSLNDDLTVVILKRL
jgi:sigma-B regulation protein RsbU (phosphoserine phosphatase)